MAGGEAHRGSDQHVLDLGRFLLGAEVSASHLSWPERMRVRSCQCSVLSLASRVKDLCTGTKSCCDTGEPWCNVILTDHPCIPSWSCKGRRWSLSSRSPRRRMRPHISRQDSWRKGGRLSWTRVLHVLPCQATSNSPQAWTQEKKSIDAL